MGPHKYIIALGAQTEDADLFANPKNFAIKLLFQFFNILRLKVFLSLFVYLGFQ
jgi:hypothetical protein